MCGKTHSVTILPECHHSEVFLNKTLQSLNPLHAYISLHILLTVLYTFLKGLKRRVCLTVKGSLIVDHFPYSHDLNVLFRVDIVRRN